jgi:transposase
VTDRKDADRTRLSDDDYQEAVRRYKKMRVNGHERQRYHALILVPQGYSYREVGRILLVDEETIRRWVEQYQERGLGGRRNPPHGGGEHGQRELSGEQVEKSQRILRVEARAGTQVGSGWTTKAVRQLSVERFGVTDRKSGMRKLFAHLGWSSQGGRKLYIRRDPVAQARYEVETQQVLAKYARNGQPVVPLAGDQSKVDLEGRLSRRWSPIGQQPVVADGARSKRAEKLYGAVHVGTGAEGAPFVIDGQDRDATIRWYELLLAECPQGQLLLWPDQAPPHTSDEVEEGLEMPPRIEGIAFPKYTPAENPKEGTWKDLKEAVSHPHWHETIADLRTAIAQYYQAGKTYVVTFLQKFGYRWVEGIIEPLPQTG